MSERFVLLSGCSGGGKSTLLAALRVRGYHVVEEPGRRVVKHELEKGGTALPWTDAAAFTRRTIEVALSDREAAQEQPGWVFFDRGLIDAASALEHLTGESGIEVAPGHSRQSGLDRSISLSRGLLCPYGVSRRSARDRRTAARHYHSVMFPDLPFRRPEDRELLLSGLRLAMGETT
jgi:predicted ATPase